MQRRFVLKAAGLSIISLAHPASFARAARRARTRVRPGQPGWPSSAAWDQLKRAVGGRLQHLAAPFAACAPAPDSPACSEALAALKNPFAVGDQPALTQTSGWAGAWTSQPSAYAVAASSTADVVAAVNFARTHNLRLVVKGGGHSYQGTSNAPDALLVWTRQMKDIQLHDAFVAQGCKTAQAAVSIGAGAMWIDAYDAVTTRAGRYVQGGGCTTVGVAGLVQSGGFGSFSKAYGTAAAGLIEAEVVTADGSVCIANACTNPELFWALKGGGGGSMGVVTRLTLRTRDLPETIGSASLQVQAATDMAFKALIAKVMAFYATALANPHWGEQIGFDADNTMKVSMVFQGLNKEQVQQTWEPFLAWLNTQPEYTVAKPFSAQPMPARYTWSAAFFKKYAPAVISADPRADAPPHHFSWAGDVTDTGWFVHGYHSTWLPATLLADDRQAALVDALFESTRHWTVGLHFNKGLAGAAQPEIDAARDTAMNPAVLDAFALAIIAGGSRAQFSGMPGQAERADKMQQRAAAIARATDALRQVVPSPGSYVSESDYFLKNWQQAFWGSNYARLARAKQQYDPDGLFFVHHGVGSEHWIDDGFTRT
ncbi:FAD-binding oxidoreductase [Massilia sp. S19_KUP03_FR1]|uniref:FAD-binding oxidoreductase n=1 Tax=Massilia sp. S19_KUP03_FR1 TaxID=3025503 RepID=UPI002FCD99DA